MILTSRLYHWNIHSYRHFLWWQVPEIVDETCILSITETTVRVASTVYGSATTFDAITYLFPSACNQRNSPEIQIRDREINHNLRHPSSKQAGNLGEFARISQERIILQLLVRWAMKIGLLKIK